MAKSYVWALDQEGNPCKCYASPENRGKGRCNHIGHADEGESAKQFFARIYKEEQNNVNKRDEQKENKLDTKKKTGKLTEAELAALEDADVNRAIEENKKEFINALRGIKREGIEDVIKYCEEHDMYTAPSSTRFHLASKGGLLQHSLNVYNVAKNILFDNEDGTYSYKIDGVEVARVSEDTLKISTLLHDFCKMDTYKPVYKTKKYDDGSEHKYISKYTYSEEFSFGHGEKSVYLLSRMMDLTEEEASAIRWHMGAFGNEEQTWPMNNAIKKYPFIWAVHTADMEASTFMEGLKTNNKEFSKDE